MRRDAFERIAALHDLQSQRQTEALLVELRETENAASAKSDPDLFEDDDYLAYDDRLTTLVQTIAVQTHWRNAWDALVNMRYNPESDYAGWIADHKETLPSLERLIHSPYIPRRVNAVYLIARILTISKRSHDLKESDYKRLKLLIRWHAAHDDPQVSAFAIQGLALTRDSDDIPFLNGLLTSIKDAYRRKLISDAEVLIRAS